MTIRTAILSVRRMLDKLYDRDAFLMSRDLNVTERAITHRMGLHLQQILGDEYDVDCEYNRMGTIVEGNFYTIGSEYIAKSVFLDDDVVYHEDDKGSRVFPDIIVHKRGTANNYMVIEVKINWKNDKLEHDIRKLEAYKKHLNYQYAFYVEIGESREDVKVQPY